MDQERWQQKATECTLKVMDVLESYGPSCSIPALVSCIKTTMSVWGLTDEQVAKTVNSITKQLDDYARYEHLELVNLMQAVEQSGGFQ
jgi:hypothetical protein